MNNIFQDQITLVPVYNEDHKVFFVSPEVSPVWEMHYASSDVKKRASHKTQFLKVPGHVPNYLALCQAPVQAPWTQNDEIDSNSLRASLLALSMTINGEDKVFFVDVSNYANTGFVPAGAMINTRVLNMLVLSFPAFSVRDAEGNTIGENLFSSFRDAGYEPRLQVQLTGNFNHYRGDVELSTVPRSITEAVDIDDRKKIISIRDSETRALFKELGEIKVIGVVLRAALCQ